MINSELVKIPGIGSARAAALLKHFKTISKIKSADIKELESAPGMTKSSAEAVYKYFN